MDNQIQKYTIYYYNMKNTKQRLFEIMSRVDKTFKPKLNEEESYDPETYTRDANISSNRADQYINNNIYKEKSSKNDEVNSNLLEFSIPDWALSSLINGDNSGNSDEDNQKINDFVSKTVSNYGNANFMIDDLDKDDQGFRHSNDIDNMGTNCYKLYLRPSK